jgi:hypothetical protein
MRKNVLHILIVGILFISSTGFAVTFHFCGDHLVSVFVNTQDEPCCGENSPCCHNETDYLQLDEEGLSPVHLDVDVNHINSILLVADIQLNDESQPLTPLVHNRELAFSPPLSSQNSLAALQTFLL